ncbi:MAG: DUF4249 family protein [Croceivirga sp.]
MQRVFYLLVSLLLFIACEEVIDVNTEPEPPRLVVNAIFRVDLTQEFIPVRIEVKETSDFFGENQVTSLDGNAQIIYGFPNPNSPEILENIGFSSLAETAPGTGIYEPDPNFDADQRIRTGAAQPGVIFQLIMKHKGRTYFASTPYVASVPIDAIEQGVESLFDEDDVELKITFTDRAESEDYYAFDFGFGNFLAVEDTFFDGQQFEFSYFYDEQLNSGQELEISILGADQQFFNYIDLLVEQTQNDGGVFETPAATARGNILDITGINNDSIVDNTSRPQDFALGYFAVIQEFKQKITIE